MKQNQPGISDRRQVERTVKCSFARLLEIYRTENPGESPHAITSLTVQVVARALQICFNAILVRRSLGANMVLSASDQQ
jgi:hypothetical protein